MMSYYLDKTMGYGGEHSGFKALKEYFFSMKSLVSFRDEHVLIGRVLLVVIAIALLLTFIDRIRRIYRFRKMQGEERLWTKIVTRDDQFLIMAFILNRQNSPFLNGSIYGCAIMFRTLLSRLHLHHTEPNTITT